MSDETLNHDLARQGFHRIGRIDAVGRRSLWLREGYDASVRITSNHPLYEQLANVMAAARFAAEWEIEGGNTLNESYALDRCPASINRTDP